MGAAPGTGLSTGVARFSTLEATLGVTIYHRAVELARRTGLACVTGAAACVAAAEVLAADLLASGVLQGKLSWQNETATAAAVVLLFII